VKLPDMSSEQFHIFESMAVSNKIDNEGMEGQVTFWNTWYLTPRVFEKEEEDKLMEDARAEATQRAAQQASRKEKESQKTNSLPGDHQYITVSENEIRDPEEPELTTRKEAVLAHWGPYLYRSKLWPLTCIFGVSFGAFISPRGIQCSLQPLRCGYGESRRLSLSAQWSFTCTLKRSFSAGITFLASSVSLPWVCILSAAF
jgi:hypothetical protein